MDSRIQTSSRITRKAAVCSDQPEATEVGLEILRLGGNAADAAIATFAAVSILQPFMCGIGGDIQCLFYRQSDKSVQAINGSGRTGAMATLKTVKNAGIEDPLYTEYTKHGLWVSVPGAVAGMFEVMKHFGSGKLSMEEILKPVIKLAEDGVNIPTKASSVWRNTSDVFSSSKNAMDLMINEKLPQEGDLLISSKLAECFKIIASLGAEEFYCGSIAKRIVAETQNAGGILTLEDMKEHFLHPPSPTPIDAVSIDFHGFKVWEMKPNTMGIVTLVILKVLEKYDLKTIGHNTAEYIHIVAEAIKLSYLESWNYLCDPNHCTLELENLLSDNTACKLRKQINLNRIIKTSIPMKGNDTSYMAVVDEEGNGCSFIASVSSCFGSGLIPDDCGFVLNDRMKCMSLDEKSPNAYGPNKFPLQTIIPALITDSKSDLMAVLGVVGRWMQPQGQAQVILNMIIFGMDPQIALNQPRFCVGQPGSFTNYTETISQLSLEEGIDTDVISSLKGKGHDCQIFDEHNRWNFGKGHIIARPSLFRSNGDLNSEMTWWSGADPRTDGYPAGF